MMLKRLLAICWLLVTIAPFAVRSQVYVAPNGNDANNGSAIAPKASLSSALRKVREMRRLHDTAVSQGIYIILKGGRYYLPEPVFIRPEDAGTEKSPTIIEAAPGEHPVLSGGIAIHGWKRADAKGKVWVADLSQAGIPDLNFRQLWVNRRKATRAKDTDGDSLNRILSWNHQTEQCWIPKPKLADLNRVAGMEMVIHQWWAIAILRIKSIAVQGDSARLTFMQPESRIQSEHPWPAPWISTETGNSAYYLTNDIRFLDRPGEWYLDRIARRLYYWPRPGEDMHTVDVVAPYLETLVRVEGTIDHPVAHIQFRGISFEHSSWLRPSQQGHVAHQAGMYMLDAYKLKIPGTPDKKTLENQAWIGRPAAAVELSYAERTRFEACRFEHLASTGLDYRKGTHQNRVNGNLFTDIGGTAILDGVFSEEADEIHLPYHPSDERVVCSKDSITNNLITDATNEDWGCVGIGAGYVRDICIEHNEISEVSYTGISIGWGWSPSPNVMRNNRVAYNKIHHYAKHMYDVAGIYTLSAQPGSFITENVIDSIYTASYAHLPEHWFYLYTDEGSSYITVSNNWTPARKFLQNANGPGNKWENNGPQVDIAVKQKAGLEAPYHFLWKESVAPHANRTINHSFKPQVIEWIVKAGTQPDEQMLATICKRYAIKPGCFYQWQNHLVIYDKWEDPYPLCKALQQALPGSVVKLYDEPLYDFNRKKHCPGTQVASEWDHIILTASLVKDTALQQAYIAHHATQFKKWPEVAQGFCNADFQQLQVFKNDRQLMLVISIPKGKSLDELNPKTTANNPRMDEWNQLMKKYQEGIEGTRPGEVWVFFKPIHTNH